MSDDSLSQKEKEFYAGFKSFKITVGRKLVKEKPNKEFLVSVYFYHEHNVWLAYTRYHVDDGLFGRYKIMAVSGYEAKKIALRIAKDEKMKSDFINSNHAKA